MQFDEQIVLTIFMIKKKLNKKIYKKLLNTIRIVQIRQVEETRRKLNS